MVITALAGYGTDVPRHLRKISDSFRRIAITNIRQIFPNTPSPRSPVVVEKPKRSSDTTESQPAAFILAVDPDWHPHRGEATMYIFPQDLEQCGCDYISLEEIVAGFFPDSDNDSLDL